MSTTTISINDITRTGRNLWNLNGRHYRLTAFGVTPNGCWLINPKMRELLDIDTATGQDVYGSHMLEFDGCVGTVPADYEYIHA